MSVLETLRDDNLGRYLKSDTYSHYLEKRKARKNTRDDRVVEIGNPRRFRFFFSSSIFLIFMFFFLFSGNSILFNLRRGF